MQSKAICALGWTWRPLMLLHGSLFVGLKWMQWIGLLSTFGKTCETKGYLRSIDSFLGYKSRLYFDYAEKYCVTQNWGDNLELNVYVNWHSFLFFENVTWHFGFEVERQMRFVKHTHLCKGIFIFALEVDVTVFSLIVEIPPLQLST